MSKILRAVCEQMPKNLDFDRIWRQEAIDFEDLRGDKGVLYSPSGGPAGSRRASQPPPRPHPPGPLNKALKKKTMDITFSADAATMRVTIEKLLGCSSKY